MHNITGGAFSEANPEGLVIYVTVRKQTKCAIPHKNALNLLIANAATDVRQMAGRGVR